MTQTKARPQPGARYLIALFPAVIGLFFHATTLASPPEKSSNGLAASAIATSVVSGTACKPDASARETLRRILLPALEKTDLGLIQRRFKSGAIESVAIDGTAGYFEVTCSFGSGPCERYSFVAGRLMNNIQMQDTVREFGGKFSFSRPRHFDEAREVNTLGREPLARYYHLNQPGGMVCTLFVRLFSDDGIHVSQIHVDKE